MKIWLDDLRVAPDGYETAKSVNEAIDLIEECEQNGDEIEVLDLDHDLGDYAYDGGDAIKLLDYLRKEKHFIPWKSIQQIRLEGKICIECLTGIGLIYINQLCFVFLVNKSRAGSQI